MGPNIGGKWSGFEPQHHQIIHCSALASQWVEHASLLPSVKRRWYLALPWGKIKQHVWRGCLEQACTMRDIILEWLGQAHPLLHFHWARQNGGRSPGKPWRRDGRTWRRMKYLVELCSHPCGNCKVRVRGPGPKKHEDYHAWPHSLPFHLRQSPVDLQISSSTFHFLSVSLVDS